MPKQDKPVKPYGTSAYLKSVFVYSNKSFFHKLVDALNWPYRVFNGTYRFVISPQESESHQIKIYKEKNVSTGNKILAGLLFPLGLIFGWLAKQLAHACSSTLKQYYPQTKAEFERSMTLESKFKHYVKKHFENISNDSNRQIAPYRNAYLALEEQLNTMKRCFTCASNWEQDWKTSAKSFNQLFASSIDAAAEFVAQMDRYFISSGKQPTPKDYATLLTAPHAYNHRNFHVLVDLYYMARLKLTYHQSQSGTPHVNMSYSKCRCKNNDDKAMMAVFRKQAPKFYQYGTLQSIWRKQYNTFFKEFITHCGGREFEKALQAKAPTFFQLIKRDSAADDYFLRTLPDRPKSW